MIGIVIPAHNEAHDLRACLAAIQQSIQLLQLSQEREARVLVVLDNCSDDSLAIVKAAGVAYLSCHFSCVGQTRDFGIRHMIGLGATWIACTDADSCVDPQWLLQQCMHQPTDAICGVVQIDNWHTLSSDTQKQYLNHYQDCMDHRHIHGANLSFSSSAYIQAGGFKALSCHEDVNLVERMQTMNLKIVWSNLVRVTTSSRLDARAPEGFASFLQQLEETPTAPLK